jgi:hypothetical protein
MEFSQVFMIPWTWTVVKSKELLWGLCHLFYELGTYYCLYGYLPHDRHMISFTRTSRVTEQQTFTHQHMGCLNLGNWTCHGKIHKKNVIKCSWRKWIGMRMFTHEKHLPVISISTNWLHLKMGSGTKDRNLCGIAYGMNFANIQ